MIKRNVNCLLEPETLRQQLKVSLCKLLYLNGELH